MRTLICKKRWKATRLPTQVSIETGSDIKTGPDLLVGCGVISLMFRAPVQIESGDEWNSGMDVYISTIAR